LKRYFLDKTINTFVVPSEDLRTKMKNNGINAVLLRHYVDLSQYPVVDPYPRDSRLLFVGRLKEGKGVGVLLEAFKRVVKQIPSARLELVGADEEEGKFEKQSSVLGIRDRVVFHDLVPHEKIAEFYAKATIIVLPASWIENSPLVLLEAMASGRAVVAGNIGGIPEIVIGGETGLLCTPGDPEDLSRKILRLLKDKEMATEMGMMGRKRIETHFGLEDHLKGYFDILKKISGESLAELKVLFSKYNRNS
jgi:glycosyltransferase involved in cell wall biosynthesis